MRERVGATRPGERETPDRDADSVREERAGGQTKTGAYDECAIRIGAQDARTVSCASEGSTRHNRSNPDLSARASRPPDLGPAIHSSACSPTHRAPCSITTSCPERTAVLWAAHIADCLYAGILHYACVTTEVACKRCACAAVQRRRLFCVQRYMRSLQLR